MKLYILISLIIFSENALSQTYKKFKITANVHTISINANQGYFSNNIQYDENNNLLIRNVNKPKPVIEVFSLKTGKLVYTIPLAYKTSSFTFLKNGNYWTHDSMNRSYKLINKKGQILKIIKEQNYDQNTTFINTSPNIFAPIIVYKDNLYVTGSIMFKDAKNLDNHIYKKTGIIEKIPFNGEIKFIGRPATKSNIYFYGNMNNYSITSNLNTIYASPYFSNEIQELNLITGSIKNIILNNKYGNKIVPLSTINKASSFSNRENNEYYKKSYSYVGFVYDKYKDVYYRFVRFPLQSTKSLDCNIEVYDNKFRFLFEAQINSKRYNVSQHFLTKTGIAFLNLENYRKDDTKLNYDIFSLTN